MATIYEVARAAGVSTATVSRVFSGGSVSDGRAQRVRAAATELGFHPNSVARSLRRQRSDVLALILPDIQNPFFTSVARGVEDAARGSGLSVVLCNSDEDLARERQYVQIALAQQVAGLVIAPASRKDTDLAPVLDRAIPVVAVDRRPEGVAVDVVMVDNRRGGRQATAHLVESGYRSIACITGPDGTWTADERLAGYTYEIRRQLRSRDCTGRAATEWIRQHTRRGDFRAESGRSAMQSLLALPTPPDAVFVANNLMAIGAVQALRDAGATLPDFGLVSFGDPPWTQLLSPRLSAISQPAHQLGWTAAEVLTRRIAGDVSPATTTILPTGLVVRESSLRTPDVRAPQRNRSNGRQVRPGRRLARQSR